MATGETGFDDVSFEVMEADSQRAHRCHEYLARLSGARPAAR